MGGDALIVVVRFILGFALWVLVFGALKPSVSQAQNTLDSGAVMVPQGQSLSSIRELMRSRRHADAVLPLRQLLQADPDNTKAWEMLAVSYYYLGRVKEAIKLLKFAEFRSSPDPAYNYLFQGMGYIVLKKYDLAATYLKKSKDIKKSPFAQLAAYELAVFYYNRRKPLRTRRWFNYYLKHYPNSKNSKVLRAFQEHLKLGVFRGRLKGIPKPDLEHAFYRHAPLSLMNLPHYWFLSTGGTSIEEYGREVDQTNPAKALAFKDRVDHLYILNFDSGIGLGPFDLGDVSLVAGYNYLQKWNTTVERFNVYVDDPSDIRYFLFRPDLLERHHQLYSKFEVLSLQPLSFGAELMGETRRIGASSWLGEGPEPWDWSQNLTLAHRWVLSPWVGYRLSPRHLLKAYAYVMQEYNKQNQDFSHQTLSLDGLPLAYGAGYIGTFPRFQLSLDLDVFYYDYVFNDPFLDHSKMGVVGRVSYGVFSEFKLFLQGIYSDDTYTEKHVKLGSCRARLGGVDKSKVDLRKPHKCPRTETYLSAQFGIDLTYRDSYGIFLMGQYLDNQSIEFEELSFEQMKFVAGVVIAFPDVLGVRRNATIFTDRTVLETVQQ